MSGQEFWVWSLIRWTLAGTGTTGTTATTVIILLAPIGHPSPRILNRLTSRGAKTAAESVRVVETAAPSCLNRSLRGLDSV